MNKPELRLKLLLGQAKAGKPLARRDLDWIRSELESERDTADPYTLLHVLGKANDRTAASVIRRYLHYGVGDGEDDGMVRRIAMQILAHWWQLKDVFPAAQQMAAEDPSPFARAIAASALGVLGAAHPELAAEAARSLVDGINRYGSEQKDVWGNFYVGMLELVGVDVSLRPVRPAELNLETLDREVIARVRELADGRR